MAIKFSEEQRSYAISLYKEGYTIVQTVEITGISARVALRFEHEK